MTLRSGVLAPVVVALVVIAGCASPAPSPPPTPAPPPSAAALPTEPATPTPTAAATAQTTPGAVPPGTVLVDVPAAGVRIPVPEGWEQVDAEALGDPARREELVARYPGVGALLDAAAEMGERAVPAFAAFDPGAGPDATLAPNIAVLVAQPSVSGPLLDLVAGFVGGGLEDSLGAEEVSRGRVPTALGEAVRLEYALTAGDGPGMTAVEYLVGAPAGTLLVSVMGPAGAPAALDADALVAALAPLP